MSPEPCPSYSASRSGPMIYPALAWISRLPAPHDWPRAPRHAQADRPFDWLDTWPPALPGGPIHDYGPNSVTACGRVVVYVSPPSNSDSLLTLLPRPEPTVSGSNSAPKCTLVLGLIPSCTSAARSQSTIAELAS